MFQQMKRELLGFWQLRLVKIKRPFCAPAPPKQAHWDPWTWHSHQGQLLQQGHTWSWQKTEHLQWAAGKHYSGFSVWKVSPKEDNTMKCFVFFQAKLQTLGRWLCQTEALLGAVNLPGLVRRSSIYRHKRAWTRLKDNLVKGFQRKKWKLLLIHWMSIFPMAARLGNVSVSKLSSWKSYHVTLIGFLRGKNCLSSREKKKKNFYSILINE